jgi:RNA polymerase sigma factor (sigma-70 family)
MTPPALAEMITSLHEGRIGSWTALLDEIAPRLIGFFERDGVDHHLAEDLTQEVLETVFRKLDELRDPRRFPSWLRMIARNRLRSRIRSLRYTEVLEEPVEARDGLSRLYGDDLRRLVREEVCRFGPLARRMLELRLLEDRTPDEVVSIMGITRDHYRKRFHVAIKALRLRLQCRIDGAPLPGRNPDGSHPERLGGLTPGATVLGEPQ